MAILRYLARKNGLDATTEEEHIRVDLAQGILSDIWGGFHFLVYTSDFVSVFLKFKIALSESCFADT